MKTIFCTVDSEFQADGILIELKRNGFSEDAISVLFRETIRTSIGLQTPEGTDGGAIAETGVGSGLGWLEGAGMVGIPGAGPFVAAGPVLAAAQEAGSPRGLTGTLSGIGLPDAAAPGFAAGIRQGNVLIGVYVETDKALVRARRICQSGNARDFVIVEASQSLPSNQTMEWNYASRPVER